MFRAKGTVFTAGSRLIMYGGCFWVWRWAFRRCMKVVFPEPVKVRQFYSSCRVIGGEGDTSHADANNCWWRAAS